MNNVNDKVDKIIYEYESALIRNADISEEMFMASFLTEMKWSYQQYMETPYEIICLIAGKNHADKKYNESQNPKK